MEAQNDLNIVLVGMMGAGKTYIGGKLAKLLAHFTYVDIDEKIEEHAGLTISEFFDKYSEENFRNLESKIIKEVSEKKNQIISVGGGAFKREENIKELKKNGIIYYLKAPAKELFDRLKIEDSAQSKRPVISNDFSLASIEKLLKEREKNYHKADFIVDTYKKQAYTTLDEIIKEYENYVKKRTLC